MDENIIKMTAFAFVIIVFLLSFRKQVSVYLKAFGIKLKLDGSNEKPLSVGIRAKDLQADKDIRAHEKGGRGIDAEKFKAKGSITLTNEASPGGADSPKP